MEEEEGHTEASDSIERLRDFRTKVNSQPSLVSSGSTYEEHGAASMGPAGREVRLGFLSSIPNAGSASPSDTHAVFGDFSRESDTSYLSRYAGPSGTNMMLNPKRAYRQRRKDPSCDACRERKVKVIVILRAASHLTYRNQCDATDTTSCTECSSRNVRCQFTKDTNRRMSSIKYDPQPTSIKLCF